MDAEYASGSECARVVDITVLNMPLLSEYARILNIPGLKKDHNMPEYV